MAKKFVRGITDIKTITNQDFDTNNVNDLLSDGKNNYIHRKKHDGSEEYHNLTDNLKTLTSDNTDLLEVTNNNDTTNSAELHPKHDSAKEQLLESTRGTITITHGENATTETTKVDTNPQKVLEHDNLMVGDGLLLSHSGNTSTINIASTHKQWGTNIDDSIEGIIYGNGFTTPPVNDTSNSASYVTLKTKDDEKFQLYIRQSSVSQGKAILASRFLTSQGPTSWKYWSVDSEELTQQLATKQNTLQTNASIGVVGTGLRQLYTLKQTYNDTGGLLKTHVKSISENNNLNTPEQEFNFIVKLDKNVSDVTFTLNSFDTTKFSNIMNEYGENNTVRISGCVFTLNGSTLTVSTTNNTAQNYVITFSDII